MKSVTRYSNWGYWDQLDGVTLKEGELISVQWGDGTVTKESVVIREYNTVTSDHGHMCDIPHVEAYVKTSVHGTETLIRLYNNNLLCERYLGYLR